MPTVVYTVAASHDDTYYDTLGVQCFNDAATISIGYVPFYRGGVRFANVQLDGTSHIIKAAHLRLRCHANSTGHPLLIVGHDEDNTATYTAPNCNPADRAATTATVTWATGVMVADSWYETDDIAAIVQEIIDRAGWASGNAIGFRLSHAAEPQESVFYSYDHAVAGASAPELHVTYCDKFQGGGIL